MLQSKTIETHDTRPVFAVFSLQQYADSCQDVDEPSPMCGVLATQTLNFVLVDELYTPLIVQGRWNYFSAVDDRCFPLARQPAYHRNSFHAPTLEQF